MKISVGVTDHQFEDERARYGKETTIRPRRGQSAFKVGVTDAYRRSCAITEGHSLPALEAAHIKPFGEIGPDRDAVASRGP